MTNKKQTTILLVEDEKGIRDLLSFTFSHTEYQLFEAANISEAKKILFSTRIELILLDWMLPEESGINFMHWLKSNENFQQLPIIMLTAKAEETNKIRGLRAGADDYVTKPFSPQELIARISAVLRRGILISPEKSLTYKELHINLNNHQVKINGNTLELSANEYQMITFFMRHPNKTYSRDQLISHIWGYDTYIDDRSVDQQIKRLRAKLKPYNYHKYIKTIHKTGYQFELNHE